MKNEKIEVYGTFGPSCKATETLEEMIQCGMTGMRLNLSHTTLEKSKEYLDNYFSNEIISFSQNIKTEDIKSNKINDLKNAYKFDFKEVSEEIEKGDVTNERSIRKT